MYIGQELEKDYIFERNPEISIITSMETKVWWRCSVNKKHEWQATIRHRLKNHSGCPFCNGKKTLHEESLFALYPEVANQWDYIKNNVDPSSVAPKSSKYYFWKCKNNHEWSAPVVRRTFYKTGCPYCSGHKVTKSNSLAVTHPEIAAEWDTKKNNKTPFDVSKGCESKFYWCCSSGHSWQATPNNRTCGTGCPQCKIWLGEEKIAEALSFLNKTYIRNYSFNDCRHKKVLRFDFAVFNGSCIECLIEYQGIQHYKPIESWGGLKQFEINKIRDQIKRDYCCSNGYKLFEISYRKFKDLSPEFVATLLAR